jgi:cell division protein ZipA
MQGLPPGAAEIALGESAVSPTPAAPPQAQPHGLPPQQLLQFGAAPPPPSQVGMVPILNPASAAPMPPSLQPQMAPYQQQYQQQQPSQQYQQQYQQQQPSQQ